jgi:putative spermidine/putrescine transport system permease protein
MTPARLIAVVAALFLAAPLFIVVPMSFSTAPSMIFPPPGFWAGYYVRFFQDPNWTGAVANSLIIGVGSTALTLALAIPASFALVRHGAFFGRKLFYLMIMAPMIVPHIVMALGYYLYFGDIRLSQSYLGVILAHACLSIPVAVLIVTAALKGFDRNLERAAMNLGASPLATFRLVTLPVLWPAFAVAGLFAFVHSFDETVIALFISGRDRSTLPRQMFNSFRMEADPVVSVASSLLFVAAFLVIALPPLVRLIRRRAAGQGR